MFQAEAPLGQGRGWREGARREQKEMGSLQGFGFADQLDNWPVPGKRGIPAPYG